jgi:hypothetical protein
MKVIPGNNDEFDIEKQQAIENIKKDSLLLAQTKISPDPKFRALAACAFLQIAKDKNPKYKITKDCNNYATKGDFAIDILWQYFSKYAPKANVDEVAKALISILEDARKAKRLSSATKRLQELMKSEGLNAIHISNDQLFEEIRSQKKQNLFNKLLTDANPEIAGCCLAIKMEEYFRKNIMDSMPAGTTLLACGSIIWFLALIAVFILPISPLIAAGSLVVSGIALFTNYLKIERHQWLDKFAGMKGLESHFSSEKEMARLKVAFSHLSADLSPPASSPLAIASISQIMGSLQAETS